MPLHVNVEELLNHCFEESDWFKIKKWTPKAVYLSICAFANNFENTGLSCTFHYTIKFI